MSEKKNRYGRDVAIDMLKRIPVWPETITQKALFAPYRTYSAAHSVMQSLAVDLPLCEDTDEKGKTIYCYADDMDKKKALAYYGVVL